MFESKFCAQLFMDLPINNFDVFIACMSNNFNGSLAHGNRSKGGVSLTKCPVNQSAVCVKVWRE